MACGRRSARECGGRSISRHKKFRYSKALPGLPVDNTHIVAVVLFRFDERDDGRPAPNNYVVTAFQKQIG
jgi:hypothetical protein